MGGARTRPLMIGSVKTNIGHLESAAGIAGLIKVVLALQHDEIPPHLHLKTLNPYIPLDEIPAVIPTSCVPWASDGRRRIAGVSSFGFSGTNAHLVVEEAPVARLEPSKIERPLHVLAFSAKTDDALRALTERFSCHLSDHGDQALADVCYTAATGRAHFQHRVAVVAETVDDARIKLSAYRSADATAAAPGQATRPPKVGFLFRGTPLRIGRRFYQSQPGFRRVLDRCAELAAQPAASWLEGNGASPDLAAFAIEFAWAELWRAWGVEPWAAAGHGVGEYVAACAAGVMTVEQAMAIVGDESRAAAESTYSSPRIRLISTASAQPVKEECRDATYWRRPRTLEESPVEIEKVTQALRQYGCDIVLSSLEPARNEWEATLEIVAQLYVRGFPIDWAGFDTGYVRRKVALPTYPFQRRRYRIDEHEGIERRGERDTVVASPAVPQHWLHEVAWRPVPGLQPDSAPDHTQQRSTWLILADRSGVGARVAELLEKRGERPVLVSPPDLPDDPEHVDALIRNVLDARDVSCRGVIHLWSIGRPSPAESNATTLGAAQTFGCGSALCVLQAMARREGQRSPRLWLVTQGAQSVNAVGAPVAVEQASLWGWGRVAAHEHPALWGGLVDLDPQDSTEGPAALVTEILRGDEHQVAYRGGRRFVARLVAMPSSAIDHEANALRSDATYLITGGLGGLGLTVAHWMARSGAGTIVLMGRHGPSEGQTIAIREIERAGATVIVAKGDVSVANDVARVLADVKESQPRLRGIIHAAGVLDDGFLLRQTSDKLSSVMMPKVEGAWHLHRLTLDTPLDLFVLFSSASSLLGPPGLSSYAAANAFLDAMAHYRRGLGLAGLTINWGQWAQVGMAAHLDKRRSRHVAGLEQIAPDDGVRLLEQLVRRDVTQAAVLPADWSVLSAQFPGETFLADLIGEKSQGATLAIHGTDDTDLLAELREIPPDRRHAFVKAHLARRIAPIVAMPEQEVNTEANLLNVGVDSLMALEFLKVLERDFQLAFYPREFYEHPSIDALARYLLEELDNTPRRAGTGSLPPVVAPPMTLSPDSGRGARIRSQPALHRNKSVVFLLSSPRSGSTLLRVMLAGHSALFCPPELHLLPFQNMQDRREGLGLSYFAEGLERGLMDLKSMDVDRTKAFVGDLVERNASIQEVYGLLQDLAGSRVLLDKSATYATSLEILERAEDLFEDPKYIALTRHPYAVIESFVRNRMDKLVSAGDADPYWLAEHVWATTNRNILRFLQTIDQTRWQHVRYEDLVREPRETLTRLCEFLGIPFEDAVLEPYQGSRMTDGVRPQSKPIGDPNFLNHAGIEAALGDAWKSVRLGRPLDHFSRSVTAELGYELPTESGPPAARLAMIESYLETRGMRLCLCSWGPEDGPVGTVPPRHPGSWRRLGRGRPAPGRSRLSHHRARLARTWTVGARRVEQLLPTAGLRWRHRRDRTRRHAGTVHDRRALDGSRDRSTVRECPARADQISRPCGGRRSLRGGPGSLSQARRSPGLSGHRAASPDIHGPERCC